MEAGIGEMIHLNIRWAIQYSMYTLISVHHPLIITRSFLFSSRPCIQETNESRTKRLQHVLTREQARTRYGRAGLLSHPNPLFLYNYFIVRDTNRDSSE
ncbi:hypothetical protein TNCV_4512301 [Trichonephila clavipes]|nr:hypothetical protein TNCV_4512301 [Trichonephila clavipes]